MSEKQLQHRIVMKFSHDYPHLRGCLFLIDNDTHNVKHAMTKKSSGMVAGVSDLILVHPITKIMCGIEIKAPNSRHKTSHLQQQIEWGVNVPKGYIMSADESEINNFIYRALKYNEYPKIYPNIDLTKKTHKWK